ncbi:hypothetical protein DL766_005976 [Monosporascus sp. MC13-8B]|uniref:SGNH hydrolase-type esterase domain-containing protein n=1 Tax=Monosporascus cannonballus TaxID=155416 RepID=A0ABY0H7J6_9PEZI|nr:hypothetical protein DL762_004497 [Monosporascus cannonballus]RYO94703.1 hypothetical protein DL763_003977 [Monosporascus cannonballus]RYP28231.1 hypothetical protein DL766_005976 [Monosporascus sp. MC13-8B]
MLPLVLVWARVAVAAGVRGLEDVKNLVVFGDSYTDEGRLSWFIENGGRPPPPGTSIPTSNSTASGGYSWPYFASLALGATTFNYAVSGATCSNELTLRNLEAINAPFPSVADYEVPAFLADTAYMDPTTGTNTLYGADFTENERANNTVYALWIGTNDLGANAFLTDSQERGATFADDFVDCIWRVFDSLYGAGGRRFVLFNTVPLERLPMYAAPQNGGTMVTRYWDTKMDYNATAYEQKMREYTTAVNKIFEYGAPFQLLVKDRWPGATFAVFDVHSLVGDIIAHPKRYLDEPADVVGFYWRCSNTEGDDCKGSQHPLSSFLWYDELHPSERTEEIIAEEFVKLVHGESKYGSYYY